MRVFFLEACGLLAAATFGGLGATLLTQRSIEIAIAVVLVLMTAGVVALVYVPY